MIIDNKQSYGSNSDIKTVLNRILLFGELPESDRKLRFLGYTKYRWLPYEIEKTGFDKVVSIGINHNGYGLVSKTQHPLKNNFTLQHRVREWYIYNQHIVNRKKDLERLS